ncbi:MAG: GlsB/YeaQ/YmgE family stress response membrane protein [Rubrobacteraceae bacterium]
MGILSWVIFGLIAGIVAKLVMPGRDPGGCIVTMLIGIAGAFLGGFLYELVTGRQQFMVFDLGSMALAIVGAVVILAIYRAVLGNRA